MFIDRLDKNRFLIVVNETEYNNFTDTLSGLVVIAAVKAGFSLKGRRIRVATLKGIGSVYYLVTVEAQRLLPTAGIRHYAVTFVNAYDLISCAYRLADYINLISFSELLYRDNSYTLVVGIYRKHSVLFQAVLSEYGKTVCVDTKQTASLEELSENIIHHKAINKIALLK